MSNRNQEIQDKLLAKYYARLKGSETPEPENTDKEEEDNDTDFDKAWIRFQQMLKNNAALSMSPLKKQKINVNMFDNFIKTLNKRDKKVPPRPGLTFNAKSSRWTKSNPNQKGSYIDEIIRWISDMDKKLNEAKEEHDYKKYHHLMNRFIKIKQKLDEVI